MCGNMLLSISPLHEEQSRISSHKKQSQKLFLSRAQSFGPTFKPTEYNLLQCKNFSTFLKLKVQFD